MTPPVLLDLTGDGVVDIVFATYNSTVLALDGQTYATLWNFTYPLSETYASVFWGFLNLSRVTSPKLYGYLFICTKHGNKGGF